MATVSVQIVQTGYSEYTVARYTITGSDVSNYGEIRVLPASATVYDVDSKNYWNDAPPSGGRSSPVEINMCIPVLAASLNFSPASGSETSRSTQLWGWNNSANSWQKIGGAVTVYPGYAWLDRSSCSTVPGDEEHKIQVSGYTRCWIPKEGETYHPERGECWYQNIGFVEAQYVENSDGTLNVTVPSSRIKGSTKTGFVIEQTAEGTYGKLSTIATGLPHLTKLYVYGQGKDGVWYLLNSRFVPSNTFCTTSDGHGWTSMT